jgi:leader peptidase (prepilin peptidase) / N-methyltransferase
MVKPMFDPGIWAAVPFHFWSVVLFVFGCMVGSFLNVCIHRMPLGQSIVSPPSHCPHCGYSIPWYLNIPLVTWLYLRGKCRNCRAPISIRYFLVELLTGLLFLVCWLAFGQQSGWMALIYCGFMAGLVVATFIDFEHMIIPDEITIGGMLAGFLCSFFVPGLQDESSLAGAMRQSLLGMALGGGVIYLAVRAGKLAFGRQRMVFDGETRVVFTETALQVPGRAIPYDDVFYRESDTISLRARLVELVDRCYRDVMVRLSPARLRIGEEEFDPSQVSCLEAVSSEVVLPREAMGLGDVKFMAAIGAFLGWKAVLFALVTSSMIGSVIGIAPLLVGRRARSRLPFGPYLALGATIWVFFGPAVMTWYKGLISGWMGVGVGPTLPH